MDFEEVLLLAGAAGVVALVIRAAMQNNSDNGVDSLDTTQPGELDFTPADQTATADSSNAGPSGPVSISDWAKAVFGVEGGNAGDRNVRNNNPGNLKHAPDEFTGTPTQFDADGFVIFPSMEAGWAALNNQLSRFVSEFPSFSLTQITSRYLGQSGLNPQVTKQGNPFAYADEVASSLGVSADQTLQQIFGGN